MLWFHERNCRTKAWDNMGMMRMINVTYAGNKTINLQDEYETDIMQGNLIDCFSYSCSWAKDGEKINFHIKNTDHKEILKLKEHLEKQTTHAISNDDDNELRIKIKTEYTARNIIKNIYHEYNEPSTTQIKRPTRTADKIDGLGILSNDDEWSISGVLEGD